MAAIIDDHLEPVGVISDPAQQIRIGLAPMVGPNPVPIDERLVLESKPRICARGKNTFHICNEAPPSR